MGWIGSCIFVKTDVRKLIMAKAKNPPQNAVGTSHGVLKNQIGTLKGDGAKCGAKLADTPRVISLEVTQPWGGQRRLQCLVDGLSPACWSEDHPRI